MPKKQPKIRSFTTVHHEAQLKLGLTFTEYIVCDLVYHLANNPDNEVREWCWASQETIGEMIGISDRTIRTCLTKLKNKGLVEDHPERRGLRRTTSKWYESVNFSIRKKLPDNRKHLPSQPEETSGKNRKKLPTTYRVDNKSNNTLLRKGDKPRYGNADINQVMDEFESQYGIKLPNAKEERRYASTLIRKYGLDVTLRAVRAARSAADDQYGPKITSPKKLHFKWADLVVYCNQKNKNPGVVKIS